MNRYVCQWCGQALDERDRRDRRTCSVRCRVARWRSGAARDAEGDSEPRNDHVQVFPDVSVPCSRYIGSVGPGALAVAQDGESQA